VRRGVAIILAGVAVAGAVYFGGLRLAQGSGYCAPGKGFITGLGPRGGCPLRRWKHYRRRATWQTPVAIVIAAVGFGAAAVVARDT
jgi:hypothetical protein